MENLLTSALNLKKSLEREVAIFFKVSEQYVHTMLFVSFVILITLYEYIF